MAICQHGCEDDLADALCVIERFEPEHPGLACLDATLATPPVCTISDVQRFGRADQAEQLLPACDASGRVPCWHAVDDPACYVGTEIRVERGDLEIPFDDEVVGNCVPG